MLADLQRGGDVTGGRIAVADRPSRRVGAELLGQELILDVGLAGQQHEHDRPQVEHGQVHRLGPTAGSRASSDPAPPGIGRTAWRRSVSASGRVRRVRPASFRGSNAEGDRSERDALERRIAGWRPRLAPSPSRCGPRGRAVVRRAVVVLARGDVAAASRDVDLRHPRQTPLPGPASQPDEVGRDPAPPVVAHRVDRVVAQGQERLVAVPEAQRLEPGVDGPLRGVVGGRVVRGARAVVRRWSRRADITAVRGDLLHPRLADAEMGDAPGRPSEAAAAPRPRAGRPSWNSRSQMEPRSAVPRASAAARGSAIGASCWWIAATRTCSRSVPAASASTSRQRS